MSVRTIPLHDTVVILRKPFTQMQTSEGAPIGDSKTGEPIYVAEAVIPGLLRGSFSLDDSPTAARIKVVGRDPGHAENSIVRLINPKITGWYVPRARGADAKSDVTISAERVEAAPGERPAMRGGLPAHTNGVAATLLDQTHDLTGAPQSISVMFDAADVFQVEGVAEIKCPTVISEAMFMQRVELTGLRAYFVIPDSGDVSQRAKAELILACNGVAPFPTAHAGNGRKPRPEPAAETEQPVG